METTTPEEVHLRIKSVEPGHSGERVIMRIRPPDASCQRANRSQSGALMYSFECAPLGPSSGEINGPSRWMPPILASTSGTELHARDIVPSNDSVSSSLLLIIVGKKVVTPCSHLSLIHISEPTRLGMISYAV